MLSTMYFSTRTRKSKFCHVERLELERWLFWEACLDARVLYCTHVFSHTCLFAHKHVKQFTALDKSFSMQNNIYRDTLCFAYYICAYLRDR